MHTISTKPLDGLQQLETLGYTSAPMIPGGDGVPGWQDASGQPVKFHECFPAQAREAMSAGATAERGVVPNGDVIALRAFGEAREHLPASSAMWDAGDCRVALYRADDDLSAFFGFDLPPRSFGWQADDRGLLIIERAMAVTVPPGVVLPPAADLPRVSAAAVQTARKAMGDGDLTFVPFDPEEEWHAARSAAQHAIALGRKPVLFPADEPNDPFLVRRNELAKIAREVRRETDIGRATDWALRNARIVAQCARQSQDASFVGPPAAPYFAGKVFRSIASISFFGGSAFAVATACQREACGVLDFEAQAVKPLTAQVASAHDLADFLSGDVFDLPDDDSSIKPIAFLLGKDFARGFMTATIAAGGVGKSMVSLVEGLSLATGRDLMSADPTAAGGVKERVPVLILSLEDSPDIVRMRLTAICRHFNIAKEEIGGRLRVRCGVDIPAGLIVAETTRNGTEIKRPVIDALVAAVQRNGFGKVTVDPFVSSHAISENDNVAMQRAAEAWREVAYKGNCSVELIHHARKLNGERATAEDARGGSSLIAACRFTRTLSLMDKETAEHFRTSARDAINIVGIFRDGKQNLVQRQAGAQWFKLEEQVLYNGPGGAPETAVGIPSHWSPMTVQSQEPLEVAMVLRALGRELYPVDTRSDRWIGNAVAQVMGKCAKKDRALVKGMIADLEGEELIAPDKIMNNDSKLQKVYRVTPKGFLLLAGASTEMPWGGAAGPSDDEGDCPF